MKAALKGAAFLILGILLGAAGANVLIGDQVDHLAMTNRILRSQLEDIALELQKSQESSNIKKKYTITSVETFLLLNSIEDLTEYDELRLKLEASERVREWLNPLIGQEVKEMDTLWVPSVVDNREIEVNGNKYRLRTYLVVVSEKVTVYLKASLVKQQGKL